MEVGRVDNNDSNLSNGNHMSIHLPNQSPPPILIMSKENGYSYNSSPTMGILVTNARKSYGSHSPVLNNLNMCVPKGTIYGLLGASGCGKTTILSCIVGLRKLDSGQITVFGAKPGTKESGIPGPCIGYMPQDIALYLDLSIFEILKYFGRIYGLSLSEIEKRMEYLMGFLDLPEGSRIISTLSGGQQRRTSLAVSLVHSPELLILDEPTVGVDPLLRQSIWEHIVNLTQTKKTTVIITTHYIEEARQAHTVGLMRNGKLLCEKSPDILLREHNTALLEDIVLKLCRNDMEGFTDHASASDHVGHVSTKVQSGFPGFPENNEGFDTRYDDIVSGSISGSVSGGIGARKKDINKDNEISLAISENSFYSRRNILKNLIQGGKQLQDENAVIGLKFKQTNQNQIDENQNQHFKQLQRRRSITQKATHSIKQKINIVLAIAMRNILILLRSPLFLVAIFFMPSFQVVIVNLTLGPEPRHLAFGIVDPEVNYDLSQCEGLKGNGCNVDSLSCRYIQTLPNNIIDPVSVRNKEEGLAGVQRGDLWGFMEFPANYSNHLTDRAGFGIFAENDTIDGSTISVRLDFSHYFAGALLTKALYESYQTFIVKQLTDCAQNTGKGELPMKYTAIYGNNDVTFQEYISPGVIMIILYFIPYLSTSVAIISDRKQGTLDRSMVAGVKLMDILMGFFLTEGFLIIAQTLISYLMVIYLFQTNIQGSVVAYLALTILTGFAGLSFGFLIAQIVDEEVEALVIGVGCYLPNLILTGLIWPLEGAPMAIRYISYFMPCTSAINAIRSIVSRGWSVSHPQVYPGYITLLLWIAGSWIIGFLIRRSR